MEEREGGRNKEIESEEPERGDDSGTQSLRSGW